MSNTFTPPKVKPQIKIDAETLTQLKVQEEQQVIIHGNVTHFRNGSIRIWQSTFLIPRGSTEHCKLIHAENIAIYPAWSFLGESGKRNFTLIFEGLPADCTVFDLIEVIPESGGFEVRNITRNEQDVYAVTF
jgi:hypothetical protein